MTAPRVLLLLGVAALATGCKSELDHELPGAIWATGGAANVFENERGAYLEGGQAPDGSGRLPDGSYVFAVTDLSGELLLSGVRDVRVEGGRLERVALAPFDASENGVYKVWLTKASNHPGDGPGTLASGFSPLHSRTDTFRVLRKCERDDDDRDENGGDENGGDENGGDENGGDDDGRDRDDECEDEDDRNGEDGDEPPTGEEEEPPAGEEEEPPTDDGDVDDNGCGDAFGSRYGDTFGDMNGDIWGDVYGDRFGDQNGNHYGNTFGDIFGDINGDIYGDVYGDWFGDLNGNHYGRHFGDRFGDTNGNIGQAWVCGP